MSTVTANRFPNGILSQDLGYGQSQLLTSTLEETSKLLNAYTRAILASGS